MHFLQANPVTESAGMRRNLGTFTTFTYGLPVRRYPIRLGSNPTQSVLAALLHLNRLSGGLDSNRRDKGNVVNVPMFSRVVQMLAPKDGFPDLPRKMR
jgi:hypothetical protein